MSPPAEEITQEHSPTCMAPPGQAGAGQGEMPLLDPSFLYKKTNSIKKSLQDTEILSMRAELCITALVGVGRWAH